MIADLLAIVRENFREIAIIGGLTVAYYSFTDAEAPAVSLPDDTLIIGSAVLLAALGGLAVGSAIYNLLPDPTGIYLIALEGEDDGGGEVWELTPDKFEAMEVADGSLFAWDESPERVYECLTYDPAANVAVANWRESKPSSELLGEGDVSDAMDMIAELRTAFETEARRGQAIRRRIGSIVRVLDRQRAQDQNAAIEGHTSPALADRSVDEVLREQLGEMVPENRLDVEDATDDDLDGAGDEWMTDLVLDGEGEALEPTGETHE